MTLGGLLGASMSLVTAYQIQVTSPLTHNISGTAKAAFQTLIALRIYQNPITAYGGVSVFIVLVGSLMYAFVRRTEMMNVADRLASSPFVIMPSVVEKGATIG
jgi:GDP-fucose transporter C1